MRLQYEIHSLKSIAKTEMVLLGRTPAVRLLWVFFLLISGVTVVLSHVDSDFGPNIPGVLATKAFFWFSLLRLVLTSFIAPVFVHDDSKQDTFQSLIPRPFNNSVYTVGKLLGFLSVMLLLDYFFMILFFISDVLSPRITAEIVPYLVYPIIITLPLSIFLFGVNVFFARIYYPIVYTVPVIMILLFLPFEDSLANRGFDLGAISLPMAYSSMTGFYNLPETILQRFIYIISGLALLIGTTQLMYFTRRSGNTKNYLYTVFVIGLMGILTISLTLFNNAYIDSFERPWRWANERYNIHPPLDIRSYDIEVTQSGDILDIKTTMLVSNPTDEPLNKLYLKHNVSFDTYKVVSSPDLIKDFYNPDDAIAIELTAPLLPKDCIELEVSEYGEQPVVLQSASYFNIPKDFINLLRRSGFTTLGKKYAYIEENYVLLPAELAWYPTSYSGGKVSEPKYLQHNTCTFTLKVNTQNGLIPVSQGKMTVIDENSYLFEPEIPITQLSLTIGQYQKASIDIGNVSFSYYWVGKNSRFDDIKITRDQLEDAVRGVRTEVERSLQLGYPFKRYQIVETPIHFFGHHSPLAVSSPYEQPEILFVPESFVATLYGNDISRLNRLFSRFYTTRTYSKAVSEKISPPPTLLNLGGFWQFTTNPFPDYSHILAQYAVFARGPVSPNEYFNLLSVIWLRSFFRITANSSNGTPDFNMHSHNKAAEEYLNSKSLYDIIENRDYYCEYMDVLLMASQSFYNLLAAKSNVDIMTIEATVLRCFSSYGGNVVSDLTELCGFDVLSFFNEFLYQEHNATYIISDKTVTEHSIDNRHLYNVQFIITNPTPYHGLVVSGVNTLSEEQDQRIIYLEPFSEKNIGLVSAFEPSSFYIKWQPFGSNNMRVYQTSNPYDVSTYTLTEDQDQITFFRGIKDIQVGTVPSAIILDNLEEGCRVVESNNTSLIKRFLTEHNSDSPYYRFASFKGIEDAPDEWTLAKSQGGIHEFYGAFSSCYYSKAGNGDSFVEYKFALPEVGKYEVYLSVPSGQYSQINILPLFESGQLGETTVRINDADGAYEQTVDISKAKDEWAYVGTYPFTETNPIIQITNKTNASIVIADAVQLRKVDK